MTPTQRRLLVIGTRVAVPVLILMGALLLFTLLQALAPTVREADEFRRPTQVQAFEAQRAEVKRQWVGYGTAEAHTRADVPSRVTATVLEVPEAVEAGQPVRAGDVLVRLDPSDFERQVESAEQALRQIAAQLAQLEVEQARMVERLEVETEDAELARSELERVQQLVARGAGTQQEAERARRTFLNAQRTRIATAEALDMLEPRRMNLEAQSAAQQSSLEQARLNLRRTTIVSPIDGVLQAVDVQAGENVASGQRVARVVSLDRINVPVRLPSQARSTVNVGDEAWVQAASGRNPGCPAVVSRVAPEDDTQTRTMTVFVSVHRDEMPADRPLMPGMFVSATVDSGTFEQRWIVPRRSVRAGRLYLVADGSVRSVPVSVDYMIEMEAPQFGVPDTQWAVLRDEGLTLRPGQLVVLNAARTILDGERVEPVLPEQVVSTREPLPTAAVIDGGHGGGGTR
jgi:RND family efflux transporter MFP subunit